MNCMISTSLPPGHKFGFGESIAKVAPLWYSHAPFPLTPALSLREREHRRQRIREPEALGIMSVRSLLLPLPEGEGRGEGERALEIADDESFAMGSGISDFFRGSDFGLRTSCAWKSPVAVF